MSIHTQRTLLWLRKDGYVCPPEAIVERFLSYAGKFGVRKDYLGIIDIIAIHIERKETLGIQACSTQFPSHYNKIIENEFAPLWLQAGNELELWGWSKKKVTRGGKAIRWQPRIYRFTLQDFEVIK